MVYPYRRNRIYTHDKKDLLMNSILIITVNYKNTVPTRSLVNSLEKCPNANQVKLVIIDNESSHKTKAELKSINENSKIDIHIIPSENNRYYWGGVAFGLTHLDVNNFDWTIICNNDIEFNDSTFLNQLSQLDTDQYPIIAPNVKSINTGKDLNPFLSKPISTIQDIYYSLYYYNPYTAKFIHKIGRFINRTLVRHSLDEGMSKINNLSAVDKAKADQQSAIKEIYAPHGSCIIFSNLFFKNGGHLDTGFTMYGEEVSTAEIAKALTLPVHYVPSLSLVHNDHQSTRRSSWKENYLHSKETYYYLKNKYRS